MKKRHGSAKKSASGKDRYDSFSDACAEILWRISLAIWPRSGAAKGAMWVLSADMSAGGILNSYWRKIFFSFFGSCTSLAFMVVFFANEGLLLRTNQVFAFLGLQDRVFSSVIILCLLLAALFSFMIAQGKVSSILRAYWRGVLVPSSVVAVINAALGRF